MSDCGLQIFCGRTKIGDQNKIRDQLMTIDLFHLPDDYPDYLMHSDEDTPVPSWHQVTRQSFAPDAGMIAHVSRIIANTEDEQAARDVWDSWPGNYQRS